MNFDNKIYVITTNWSYPFGGGEEFMYDTMEWAYNIGMKCYWLSFSNPKNKIYEEFEIIQHDYGKILHIPDGLNIETLKNWLYILKPDIVHHQGNFREIFYMACDDLRIPFLTGFHFWTGGIDLDSETKNKLILKNKEKHKPSKEFLFLKDKKFIHFYTASNFVKECFQEITNTYIEDVIFASSSIKRYEIKDYEPIKSKYVMMINIHKLKGGEIFYNLLKTCHNIHFACVKTEHGSEDLDKLIYDEIESRNKSNNKASCLFLNRTSNVKEIYKITKIILCISIVDETFCRVINEAMMNSIPVLTTHRGNIKYLMENSLSKPIEPDNFNGYKNEIEKLYFDENYYKEYSKSMKETFNNNSENIAKKQFTNIITKIITNSKEYNIGIITPWCDQGLGIQSKNYYNILKENNFTPSIFALKPYNADSCYDLQKNPNEWKIDNIYYSNNIREKVKDEELKEYVLKFNVGKILIPETCWDRIFEIAKYLRELSVKVYAIPNIEIVRKDEIYKHNHFHKILSNNFLCYNILGSKLKIPSEYIGYGINNVISKDKVFENDKIKFLFIGGMNAFSRKHVLNICEAFVLSYDKNNNISLTVTIQKTNTLEEKLKKQISKYLKHPAINFIQQHISYKDIINLYYNNHVSIQVSKHEGLGLGFYEGLSTGTPIITLNTPPHNEIIRNNINGWIIDCYHKEMTDNKDPLFGSAYFNPIDLSNKILEISNKKSIQNIIKTLDGDYKDRLSYDKFKNRFINAINN